MTCPTELLACLTEQVACEESLTVEAREVDRLAASADACAVALAESQATALARTEAALDAERRVARHKRQRWTWAAVGAAIGLALGLGVGL